MPVNFFSTGRTKTVIGHATKFMAQIEQAVAFAELKYPKEEGWRHVWVFDHSSCHAAMADDALEANRMNVNPGGKQRKMRDTVWEGTIQRMNDSRNVPKGMARVLTEALTCPE